MNATTTVAESLAYEVRGTGDPIVLLHGLTFDLTTWRPVVDRLAGEFRCVAIDLPGHGGTPGPPRPMADIAEDIHRLLVMLGIERPVVVGHSMGAVLAVVCAAAFPVRGVVTVDQSLDLHPFAELVRHLEPSLRGDGFTTGFEPFRRDIGVEDLPEPERGRVAATQRVDQEVVLGYFGELLRQGLEDSQTPLDTVLEAIDAPLLAVFGRALQAEEGSALRRRAPAAEIEEWPGRGHLVHLVEPDRFAHRAGAFARRCFRPSLPYDPLLAANKSLLVGLAGRCVDGHDLDALALYTDNPRVVSCITSIVIGFPDLHCRVEWVLAEHDMVAAWWSVEGTHLGAWRGVQPTGRTISACASFTVKIVDGKVAEFWICADWLRMHRQLGAAVSGEAPG